MNERPTMLSRKLPSALLPLVWALFACQPVGVSLGAQELCVADPRLADPKLRSNGEKVSVCAVLGENVLVNAGIEAPVVGPCEDGMFCQFANAEVPGWDSTSATQVIEVWNDGHEDVPAAEGAQFVELDADSQDTVWQDVALTPGQLVYWSLLHRGREGVDSFELRIGPPEAPILQGLITSPEDAWYPYSGLYRLGQTETLTRFALVSRSGTDKGNLVDATFLARVDDP